MDKFLFILFYFSIYLYVSTLADTAMSCHLKSPCICTFSSGEEIDLSTLDPAMINQPSGLNATQYFYHPCPTTTSTSCPDNTAFCSKTNNTFTILGTVQNVSFGRNSDKVNYVQYIFKDINVTRTTVMVLVCTMTSINTIEPDALVPGRLLLRSKSACLTKGDPGAGDEGLSSGSVLVLLVFVFGALYLFGGMAVLKYIRGASGVEIIPHYEFWSDLPFLVKDGIVFTLSGCQGSASYDRI